MRPIKIANLEGTVQAFANAADQNQDGQLDVKELGVFNRFIGEAGLNQDKGLVLEREKQNTNDSKMPTAKQLAKYEDKMYRECFGLKSDTSELANFKNQVANCDRRVIDVYKKLKEAGDVENMAHLNELIANRPDMTQYMKNSSGYLAQLDKYADAAEALLQQSDREFQTGLAKELHTHMDENTDLLAGITVAVADELKANMDENTAEILRGISEGTAKVIDEIRDSEGRVIQTVITAKRQICQLVKDSHDKIIEAVHYEGETTRKAITTDGDLTRKAISEDGDRTRKAVGKDDNRSGNAIRNGVIGLPEIPPGKIGYNPYLPGIGYNPAIITDGKEIRIPDEETLRELGKRIKTEANKQGKSVYEFLQENKGTVAGALLGGFSTGDPVTATVGALTGYLIFD